MPVPPFMRVNIHPPDACPFPSIRLPQLKKAPPDRCFSPSATALFAFNETTASRPLLTAETPSR